MKRSAPLRRRARLARGSGLTASKADPEKTRAWATVRALVLSRDGRCVGPAAGVPRPCWGAFHVHHVRRRSQGGTDDPANLVTLCSSCHTYVHDHPAWAVTVGLLAAR